MALYKLRFEVAVLKTLRTIPKKDLFRIHEKIHLLRLNPRPNGCEKLTNRNGYRLRQGHYRILYEINDQSITVVIVKIGHRKDIYR